MAGIFERLPEIRKAAEAMYPGNVAAQEAFIKEALAAGPLFGGHGDLFSVQIPAVAKQVTKAIIGKVPGGNVVVGAVEKYEADLKAAGVAKRQQEAARNYEILNAAEKVRVSGAGPGAGFMARLFRFAFPRRG